MRRSGIAATVASGMLVVSLALAGCGGAEPAPSQGNEDGSAASDVQGDAPANEVFSDSGAPADQLVPVCWVGQTDTGARLFYAEGIDGKSMVLIVRDAEAGDLNLMIGASRSTAEGDAVAVIDDDTGAGFGFMVDNVREGVSMDIDAGELGKGTLQSAKPEEFARELRGVSDGLEPGGESATSTDGVDLSQLKTDLDAVIEGLS